MLINQASHTLDWRVQLRGKPTHAGAAMSNHHLGGVIEVEDTMEAYLRFGEATALFYATTAHCADSPVLVELVCENATLRMEEQEVSLSWKDGKLERAGITADFPYQGEVSCQGAKAARSLAAGETVELLPTAAGLACRKA